MRRWPAVLALVALWLVTAASTLAASPRPTLISRVLPILLSSDLRITDVFGKTISQIPVTSGETIVFAVSNIAGYTVNFHIGTADELQENQVDDLPGLADFDSGTRTFTWTVPADITGLQFASTIPGHYEAGMPAPTVSLVVSSMRMKAPVWRFLRYSSTSSGVLVRMLIRPIWLSERLSALSSR